MCIRDRYIAFIRKLHVSFKKRIPISIVCISLAILCCVYIGKHTQGVVTETWEQKGSYRNGYILNFVLSIRDCFIAEPDGYSKEAVKELCQYVDNFCKENNLSAFMSVAASEDHPDGLEQIAGSIITGKTEHIVGSISGVVKANKNVYMLLSVGLMQAYTRKADINTIPFGENLNMN